MAKISVYHISEHPTLREPNGLRTFMKNHENLKKAIQIRKASRASGYEAELLLTLRNIDRIGENVNRLVDGTVGQDLNNLHPQANRIRDEIAQFNSKFDSVKNLLNRNNG